MVYILRDIKRERRDRQRILEAKTETERIMQQRERLLLTITHDIKAPAASIAGFIDLLSEYVDRPKAVGYLRAYRVRLIICCNWCRRCSTIISWRAERRSDTR